MREPSSLFRIWASQGFFTINPQHRPFWSFGGYPELVDPRVSRDFIYVDDVVQAFVDVGLKLRSPTTANPSM